MKSKTLTSFVRALSLLLFVSATCALAQDRKPVHFSGLFNDYVPLSATISGSPYEMHGQWSMDVHPEWGTADFAADMTMSGFGRTAANATPPNAVDPTQPIVNPHTHHIKLTGMKITWDMIMASKQDLQPKEFDYKLKIEPAPLPVPALGPGASA